MKNIFPFLTILGTSLLLWACQPFVDDDISLAPLPDAPQFNMTFVEQDSNRVVVTLQSGDFFSQLWSAPGGFPEISSKSSDTIFFRKAGTYTISVHVAALNGGGTATSSQQITINQDATIGCTDEITLLTGGCEDTSMKCWTFARIAGAVSVGPVPGSGEWFRSLVNGLQDAQYDDSFCFKFADSRFLYQNNGLTVDPWNGYQAVPYNPPTDHTWTLEPGAGENGELRIRLTEGSFMGVWDASNIYDVVRLTETELVVRTPFLAGGGWFELYFIAR